MAGREKRLGSQAALAVEVLFPGQPLTAVAVHLDAQSRQSHRRDQIRDVLKALEGSGPALLGGDWNTTTHNSSRAFYAIMGYWLRVFLGVDRSIEHYLHPYRWFEKELFASLAAGGFDYREANVLGEHTMSYDVTCGKTRREPRRVGPRLVLRVHPLGAQEPRGPLSAQGRLVRRPRSPHGAPFRGPRSPRGERTAALRPRRHRSRARLPIECHCASGAEPPPEG